MSSARPRRASRAAALIGSTLALGLAGLAGASAAQAGSDSWPCGSVPGSVTCPGDRHTLTSVKAFGASGRSVNAGASWNGTEGQLYANWAWGTGTTCHGYGAGNLLYPVVKNPNSTSMTMSGLSTFGSGAASC
ncbi:hypothetical protein AB0L40_13990 [Patulibacter sp. NPDC049589]|uniref:hypothetical protein n=1 Tax=Patulibacter sp. NPDC049589 TaxID=3154731 RepID=UPI0034149003